jgi:hypothetical protein
MESNIIFETFHFFVSLKVVKIAQGGQVAQSGQNHQKWCS